MPSLFDRLKERKLVQWALSYLAGAFVVVQLMDALESALGLTPTVQQAILVFLGVGFPITLILAWYHGEQGRQRVSWAEALMIGGLVATGGIAAGFLGRGDTDGPLAGPDAGAEGGEIDPGRVVVLPFRVASADPDLQTLREGMLDLLSPLLSDAPRMVDASTTLAAWRAQVTSEDQDLGEAEAVGLARRLGAGRVVLGSVVGAENEFAVTARLLSTSDGAAIGDVTAEGPAARPWSVATQVAGQIMGLEAGEQRARMDYLEDVPVEAVRAYLRGRRQYRRTVLSEARAHFVRALDIDSTFALAALGGRIAADVGWYAGKAEIENRMSRLLRAYKDRLPPDDRALADFLLQHRAWVITEQVAGAASLTEAYPDKPDTWYWLGQRLIHSSTMVADTDHLERAEAAFRRGLSLDPGNGMFDGYLALIQGLRVDTAGFLAGASAGLGHREDPGSNAFFRSLMAYEFGDTTQQAWFRASLDTLPFNDVFAMTVGGWGIPADIENGDMHQWLDALWTSAVTPEERSMAAGMRYRAFRSLGRTAEAGAELRRRAELHSLPVLGRLTDPLYWEGEEEEGAAWVARLREEFRDPSAPIGPRDWIVVCLWQIWEIRHGDTSRVEWAIRRLREEALDSDPRTAWELCPLALETMLAHARHTEDEDSLVAELARFTGQGVFGFGEAVNLELARILEARGDLRGAARVAFRPSGFYTWPNFFSTMVHEAARLHDAAGEVEEALPLYRWYLLLRKRPDPHLQPKVDRIRARVAELEATSR
jgi:tetratricopeptide (TPR) repeat protein/TolB-like protein